MSLQIDVDSEAIYLDGHWYTREDLARRIKAMLDGGDFAVARPSAALEALNTQMATVRTMAFRADAELADALMQEAQRTGKTVGAILREAAAVAVGFAPQQAAEPPPAPAPEVPPARASAPVPAPQVSAAVAGPGALRAAGVEPADRPVELTKRKEDENAEQRWFKA